MRIQLALLFFVCLSIRGAVANPPSNAATVASAAAASTAENKLWSWGMEKWTANETPYSKIRQRLRALYDRHQVNEADFNKLKKKVTADSKNPLVRYEWALYALQLASSQADSGRGSAKLYGVESALNSYPSPHSYEYSRVRFLVLCLGSGEKRKLLSIGRRLLKRDSNDVPVQRQQISNLFSNGKLDEFLEARALAANVIKVRPQEARSYVDIAWVDEHLWWKTKRPVHAENAIIEYQKALDVDKTAGNWRKQIAAGITHLKNELAAKR